MSQALRSPRVEAEDILTEVLPQGSPTLARPLEGLESALRKIQSYKDSERSHSQRKDSHAEIGVDNFTDGSSFQKGLWCGWGSCGADGRRLTHPFVQHQWELNKVRWG